jgi:hypothetical protein
MSDKITLLNELKEIANKNGGFYLSGEYINSESKLLFECQNGHQFQSCRNYIKAGNWCPFCAGKGKTINDLQLLASQRGGHCLSTVFLGMNKKHLWECSEGHQWEAIPQNIKSLGRWCPICGRIKCDQSRRKYTIKNMQDLAHSRGGICLSTNFESVIKKLTWECSEGHQWEATPHKIHQGRWCPICAKGIRGEKRKTHTIHEMKAFAHQKKGECLSSTFNHVKSKLLWQCDQGHQWEANADNIINGGKWCPICAGNQKKNLQDMQILAEKRGGKCLSTVYQGVNEKLCWECKEGHQWETIPSVIIRGGWCPECSAGLGERICRVFFDELFECSFKKSRPDWLRTLDGYQMELDGYCESLALAFEHQGLQHYEQIKHFHSLQDKLLKIQNRDKLKEYLCKINGVKLIQIPSILDIIGIDNVKSFIRNECLKKEILLPSNFDQKEIDLSRVYCPEKLRELYEVAHENGGKLISKKYLGIFEHLEWECGQGHRFWAAPNNVKNSGSWCPQCSGNQKRTINDMKQIAEQRRGKCLSTEYLKNSIPLLWECEEGHLWEARPSNVFFGTWCPECAKKKRGLKRRTHTIEEMQQIAIDRNGKCLSSEYKGTKQKLLWECEKGHQWEAIPESIFRGNTWCPKCSKKKIKN